MKIIFMRNELFFFIDESGDFGEYDYQSPFYILTLVFHDQSQDISQNLNKLLEHIDYLGYSQQNIHIGPIIRKEDIYKYEDISVRKKLLVEILYFIMFSKINYHLFCFEKKNFHDKDELIQKMIRDISLFIIEHYHFFLPYNKIIVYYDNEQNKVTRIINQICSYYFSHFEYRKVKPKEYILFQAADLICTFECLYHKYQKKKMSQSEILMIGK